MIKSYYAYLNSFGPVSFSFDLYFIELNPAYTTTSKPVQITTSRLTTRTTATPTTKTTTTSTTRQITFPVVTATATAQSQMPCKFILFNLT
jgi:hypothetical protein